MVKYCDYRKKLKDELDRAKQMLDRLIPIAIERHLKIQELERINHELTIANIKLQEKIKAYETLRGLSDETHR